MLPSVKTSLARSFHSPLARLSALAVTFAAGMPAAAQEVGGIAWDADHPPITVPVPAWATKIEDRNAALGYWIAIATQPKELIEAVAEIDWDAVGNEIDPAKLPPAFAKAAAVLDNGRWDTTEVLIASRMKRCDFESRWENGVETLLPHLGFMRRTARAMRVDARWALAHDKPVKAVEDVSAMFRMAAHVTNDRILISSLVGAAISATSRQEVEAMIASGKLTPEMRASLAAAITALRTSDPFLGKAAVQGERDIFMGWMVKAMKSGPAMRRQILSVAGTDDEKTVQGLLALKDAELDADVANGDSMYNEILAAWNTPDAQARMEKIEQRVKTGEAGMLGKVMLPSFKKANNSIRLEVSKLDELAAKLNAGK